MKKNKARAISRGREFHPDKILVAKVVAGIILISVFFTVFHNLKKLECFRVREVTVRQDGNVSREETNFAYLKGRNIFELDLDREARNAAYYYPSYQKIRITRFLPCYLVVDFLKREPIACIKASRLFYIDENLILFELPGLAAQEDLPEITGGDKYVLGAKYGARCGSSAIAAALNIIKQVGENKVLRGYKIKKVDLFGTDDASIFLFVPVPAAGELETDFTAPEQFMEVKIGREDTRGKLALLAVLLSQVKNNIYNIEYIDLRFKEPVIKFKSG